MLYRDEVIHQLELMLSQGVIKENSSPWMVRTVFVPKKSGELQSCVDYRTLNKQSVKDFYPLPPPDEIHDRLTNGPQRGYWQRGSAQDKDIKILFFWLCIFSSVSSSKELRSVAQQLYQENACFLVYLRINHWNYSYHMYVMLVTVVAAPLIASATRNIWWFIHLIIFDHSWSCGAL